MTKEKNSLKHKHLFYITPILILIILYIMGFRIIVPLTDSMEPTIPRGSLAVTAPVWLVKPKIGDVILYRIRITNEYLVLHRVVGATQEGYMTKGDNRVFRDPWTVRAKDIVGVAVLTVPILGWLLLSARPMLVFTATALLTYPIVKRILTRIILDLQRLYKEHHLYKPDNNKHEPDQYDHSHVVHRRPPILE